MSEENVEIVRRSIDAYGREGLDGSLRYYDPEIEWTSTGDYIEPATYRGHDGLRRYLGTMEEEFEDLWIEPVELIDAGEQVITSVRFTGRGKASGAPVEMTLISVGSLRDGLIYRVRNYPDMAVARKAAGVGEQAMSDENVEIVRDAFRRFQSGDQGWTEILDRDIEWDISAHPLPDVSNRGRGRDRLLSEVIATYFSGWLDYRVEIGETIDVGDDVVVVLHETARLRGSDVGLDRELVQVWSMRNGLAVYFRVFPTKAAALEAGGLRG